MSVMYSEAICHKGKCLFVSYSCVTEYKKMHINLQQKMQNILN